MSLIENSDLKKIVCYENMKTPKPKQRGFLKLLTSECY